MQTKRTSAFIVVGVIFASLPVSIGTFHGLATLADENTNDRPFGSRNPLRTTAAVDPTSPANSQHFLHLCSQAHGKDRSRALAAIYQLRECGPVGASALAQLLANPDLPMEYQFSILSSLKALGPDAVHSVLNLLRSSDDSCKIHAWQTLKHLGPDARQAIPFALELITNDQAPVSDRIAAANLLSEIAEARPGISDKLLDIAEECEHDELRLECVHAMRRLGQLQAEHQSRLVQLLLKEEEEASLRVAVASVLVQQQPPSPVVLPALISLAQDTDDTNTCVTAAESLGKLGANAEDAVPVLVKLLQSDWTDIQHSAIEACAAIGPGATDALPVLVERIRYGTHEVAESAVAALVKIDPRAVDSLLNGPESDTDARNQTLRVLTKIGPEARNVVPQLLKILADPELGDLHVGALELLGSIGPDAAEALPGIQARLLSAIQPAEIRAASALALGKISPASASVLLAALKDAESTVRIAAAQSLAHQNLRSRTAIPALICELADPLAAEFAMHALVAIGPDADPSLQELIFDDKADLDQRERACAVLARTGGNAAPVLIDALQTQNEQLADAAELALFDLGPSAAVPALVKAVRERENVAAAKRAESRIRLNSIPPDPVVDRMLRLISDLSGGLGGSMSSGGSGGKRMVLEFGPVGGPGSAASAAPMSDAPRSPAPESTPASSPWPESNMPDSASEASPSSSPAGGSSPIDPASGAPAGGSAIQPARGVKARGAMTPDSPRVEMKVVKVFYGTNRKLLETAGKRLQFFQRGFLPALVMGGATLAVCLIGIAQTRSKLAAVLAISGIIATVCLAYPALQQAGSTARTIALRPGPVYGDDPDSQLQLGTCEVTIPAIHKPGEFESPSILRFEVDQDPRKHIMLRDVTSYSNRVFHAELKRTLAEKGDSILVFVHGYNVDFDNAARRTAQLASDLEFAGAPVFFSWPSQGNWYEYRRDEKQVELAVPLLKRFLLEVAHKSKAKSIHLIAHSMGNRALTTAIQEMETASNAPATKFNQIVLAAPDIDADIFRSRIAPALLGHAQRVTLYASSNDLALTASRTFNRGDLRAGDTSRGLVLTPGIETIDVSAVDTSLLGHSYYGDNPTVLTDIKELLRTAHSADQRPYLQAKTAEQMKYWVFQHPAIANQVSPDVTIR